MDKMLADRLQIVNLGQSDLRSQIKATKEGLEETTKRLETDIATSAQSVDDRLTLKITAVIDDMQNLLKAKQRERSDLISMNERLVGKIEMLSNKVGDFQEGIESLCTVTLCLMESQCMQIRAEEQDEEDKAKIALMGQKSYTQGGGASGQPSVPMPGTVNNTSISTAPGGVAQEPLAERSFMIGDPLQPHKDSLYHSLTTDRSPLGGLTKRGDMDQSPRLPRSDFPEPIGTAPPKTRGSTQMPSTAAAAVRFQDDGIDLTPRAKQLKELGPRDKAVLSLDPVCLSHTKMQPDIIKQFKIECLAYQPSPVVFRNIEFSQAQLLVFRKFLLGQSSKIVHLKEPFKNFKMSTKRIFDDMYLFLKEANLSYIRTVASTDRSSELPLGGQQ